MVVQWLVCRLRLKDDLLGPCIAEHDPHRAPIWDLMAEIGSMQASNDTS